MKLPGGARFWNFGAFPVIAAAVFQIAIIFQAAETLGEFFLVQSIVAIGLSLACLQPRTWNAELRQPSRLRWSLLFSLVLLAAAGLYFALLPSPLGIVVGAFLAKKACDAGREFVFLASLNIPGWVTVLVTVMEVLGLLFLSLGLLLATIVIYAASGTLLIGCAMWLVRGQSWAVRWVISEVPHSISMTLFNMGSRFFLVSVPSSAAHLTIGSAVQVVNFLSPVTYAVYSRTRRVLLYVGAWLFSASVIVAGSQVFIWVGGGSGAHIGYIVAFAGLLAFNSSAVVRVSAGATRRVRALLGLSVSCWVGLGVLVGISGIYNWETSFTLFLAGNSVILICFRLWRCIPSRFDFS